VELFSFVQQTLALVVQNVVEIDEIRVHVVNAILGEASIHEDGTRTDERLD
jgi:hypothetical protein